MKKLITAIFFAVCLISALAGCGKPMMTGYFLAANAGNSGVCMILAYEGYPNGQPVIMYDQSKSGALFENFSTGDKIKITYDGAVYESYPAQTRVYDCKLIERGGAENIPQNIRDILKEYGWVPE